MPRRIAAAAAVMSPWANLQQGEAGLRIGQPAARVAVCLIRLAILPTKPVQLGQLVQRHAGRRLVGQQRAGPLRLVHRVRPLAPGLHDLRPVNQALTAERHEIWLGLTPAGERRRPLARPAEVEGLPARLDHSTVDDANHDGRHLVGGDGDHHFIEQRQTLCRFTLPDHDLTTAESGEHQEVRIVEPFTNLRRTAELRVRRLQLTGVDAAQRDRHQEVTLLRTVQPWVLHKGTRPRQPATPTRGLAAEHELEAQPERTAGRPGHLSTRAPLAVAARRQVRRLIKATDQVRRRDQQFEILGRQWPFEVH